MRKSVIWLYFCYTNIRLRPNRMNGASIAVQCFQVEANCICFQGGATSSSLNYRPCHPSHLVPPSLCLFNLIPPISLSLSFLRSVLYLLLLLTPPPQGIANHIPSSLPLSADEYRGSPTFRRRKQKLVRKGPIWPEWDWIGFAAGGRVDL